MIASLLDKGALSQEVPGTWDVASLRWLSRRFAGGTPDRNNSDFWTDGDVPWINSGAVNQGVIREPSAFVTRAALKSGATRWVPKGSLLIALAGQGKTKGMVAQTEIDTTCNQSMAAICSNGRVVERFLFWWLTSQYRSIRALAGGDLRDGLNLDMIGSIPVPIPTLGEQRAIAARLDRETARIDALIEMKQRQLKLLQEKRSALVSDTVTKGLNSKVKMKTSGLEWLDQIPEHWMVKRLKFVTPHVTVGIVVTPSKFYVDEGVPCLRSLNVRAGRLTDNDLVYISPESNRLHSKSKLRAGDVVAVRSGQPGTTAVVDRRFDGANCIDLIIIRQSRHFDSDYLSYAMGSHYVQRQFSAGSGGAIQQHFNIETASNLLIALPPISEQVAIRQFLKTEAGGLDALQGKVETSISTLREYRSATISAAVTGKLNVREEVAA